MIAHRRLVAAASVPEVVPLEDPLRRKKFQRPVNGRKRNARIDGMRAPMHFLDVGMIGRCRKHLRDHAALSRHAQAILGAAGFNRRKAFRASRGHGIRHRNEAALSL